MPDQDLTTAISAASNATLVAATGSQLVHILDLEKSERSYRVARCDIVVGDELREGDERLRYEQCPDCFEPAIPLEEALTGAEEKRAERKAAKEFAEQLGAGFRSLAAMLEANPDLADQFRYTGIDGINIPLSGDVPAVLAAFIRAGLAASASIGKSYDGKFAGATLKWGPVGIHVYAARERVCERVVTGTETVTRTVPDPALLAEVPLVEVTEEVEQVRWECRPLLAAESTVGGA